MQGQIDAFELPVQFSYLDQQITVNGDIAFSYGIVHMIGTFKQDGKEIENWLRNTTCLKKIGGEWKITHEHNSAPLDNDMKGLMELKPELSVH